MAAYVDPPFLPRLGLNAKLTAKASEAKVDPTRSSLTIIPGGDASQSVSTPIRGSVDFLGVPTSSSIGLFAALSATVPLDVAFDLPVGPVNVPARAVLTSLSLTGASEAGAIQLSTTGAGLLPSADFFLNARAHVKISPRGVVPLPPGIEGERDQALVVRPGDDLRVAMNRDSGEFFVSGGVSLAADGVKFIPAIDGVLVLRGRIENQPPTAVAGPDRVIECTSPQGTLVTLDASASSDPDHDPLAFTWRRDDAHLGNPIGFGPATIAAQPLGTVTYGVSVADKRLQVATSLTRVTVVDSTPPTFSNFSLRKKTCLWSPITSLRSSGCHTISSEWSSMRVMRRLP